jgi:protein-disulfide isomerase
MKESTKKKKTTSVSESSDSKAKVVSSNSSTTTLLLVVILVLGVVQLLVTLTMVGSGSGVSSEAEEKIDRLDSFFASNAPGYGDGTVAAAPTGDSGYGNAPAAPQVGEPDIEGRPFIGNADAAVTIVEYSDFECPFCARFYSQTYAQLKETYIASGDVKLVFKDFPLSFHQLAEPAGIAGKCVFREGGNDAFFVFHDTVFENQPALSVANLKVWAVEAGVSESAYDSCIVDPEVKAQVQADFAEGQSFGVSGTPSFVINGQLLVGAQPFSAFEQVIDAALQ